MKLFPIVLLAVCFSCSTVSAQVIMKLPTGDDSDKKEQATHVPQVTGEVVVEPAPSSSKSAKSKPAEKMAGEESTFSASGLVPNADNMRPDVLGDDVLRGEPFNMFDGTSLEGWTRANGKPTKNWVVEDGTLFRKERGGDLYHRDWYKDFDRTFDFKIQAGGNSGIKYRVQGYGEGGKRMLGCEFQLQDDKGKPFQKSSTGSLYALYPPSKNKPEIKLDDWNTARIIVCGYRVQHWLNNELVVEATFGDADWYDRVNASKFKPYSGFGLNQEGRIFLQDHGHPVWFRNVIVTSLDANQYLIK